MDAEQFLTRERNKILSILNGLQKSRSKLSLLLADSEDDEELFTTVLKVLPEANQFILSSPGSRSTMEALLDGTAFSLVGKANSVPLSLENLQYDAEEFAARDVLTIGIPESAYYEQKRDSVRLPLGDLTFSVRLLGEALELQGQMVDLSYDGCRIELPRDAEPALTSENPIYAFAATLPDTPSEAIFEAHIRHTEIHPEHIAIGMKFGELRFSEQNLVDALVMKLQRLACQARIQTG
ncbi:MAG: flagellar regulator YcgR PilZN domain-containing protein [Thiotrichales bacterium]